MVWKSQAAVVPFWLGPMLGPRVTSQDTGGVRGGSRLPTAFVWLGAATAGLELCSGAAERAAKTQGQVRPWLVPSALAESPADPLRCWSASRAQSG